MMKERWTKIGILGIFVIILACAIPVVFTTGIPAENNGGKGNPIVVFFPEETDATIPPPYTGYAKMVYVANESYLVENSVPAYCHTIQMSEEEENQLRQILLRHKMRRSFGSGENLSSDEFLYHFVLQIPSDERYDMMTIWTVGKKEKDMISQVEYHGHHYHILQDDEFQEQVWQWVTAVMRH